MKGCLYRLKRHGAHYCIRGAARTHCGFCRALWCCAKDALGGVLSSAGDRLRKVSILKGGVR